MIRFHEVTFGYGGGEAVLQRLSCAWENGAITGLIGPNGSGKSTCLRLANGLLRSQAGEIEVGKRPLGSYAPRALAREVALLPQSRPVPMITVYSLVSHGRFPHLGMPRKLSPADEAAVEEALRLTGMLEAAGRELRTLSGGQRQKAYLAMLIAQDTPHLLLDEPTTYLDIRHQLELMALLATLKDRGRCIAVVLHDLNQALSLCDRVQVLDRGRLAFDGSPAALLASGAIEAAFGVRPILRPGLAFERDCKIPCQHK